MKRALTLTALLALALASPVLAQDSGQVTVVAEDEHGWPRTFDEGGLKFTLYQPQLEKWDGTRLLGRSAVSVESAASPQPVYGVVWIVARTEIDKEERVVHLDRFALPRASFPTATDKTDEWLALLRKHVPENASRIDLDRLETSLAVAKTDKLQAATLPIKNDPPKIFFSTRPALLVLVDGEPVLRKAAGQPDLQRVINSRSLILKDERASRFYIAVGNGWLAGETIEGPWTVASAAPDGAEELKKAAVAANEVDIHDGEDIQKLVADGQPPEVHVSTGPAELIETNGAPDLTPVANTNLLWFKNTDADVFIDTATNQHYVLVSGRWFRAPSKDGPWTFVTGSELPADFAKIPNTSPAGEVLASVPNTPQAKEALIANEIPQTATVKRTEAHLDVQYDGAPQLQPVEGTPLQYAINSRTPVILDPNGNYYACENGVWFVAPAATGPWAVADSVPSDIYSIPVSSPINYVTYVRVYDATPDYVYVGYTPGYFGCYVWDGCVVWGCGWWWRPWIGSYWYGHPWTYGWGCGLRWGWHGWGVGFGYGVRLGCRPWWGPFHYAHPAFYPHSAGGGFHVNFNNANVYHAWRGAVIRPSVVASGTRSGRTLGPTSTGRTLTPSTVARPGTTPRANNVYASPEGHVYRRNEQGTWEQHQGGSWQRPAQQQFQRTRQFEAEHQARQTGAQRAQTVRTWHPQSNVSPGLRGGTVRSSFGGGGHSSGGGGGGHHR
jgi:hypothetical protein